MSVYNRVCEIYVFLFDVLVRQNFRVKEDAVLARQLQERECKLSKRIVNYVVMEIDRWVSLFNQRGQN